ncbi:MAG: hypothetical protein M3230_00595 [Thermoproteota archaeon]|nr:hypothetical protein [Thermoproteota archaeon]
MADLLIEKVSNWIFHYYYSSLKVLTTGDIRNRSPKIDKDFGFHRQYRENKYLNNIHRLIMKLGGVLQQQPSSLLKIHPSHQILFHQRQAINPSLSRFRVLVFIL